MPIEIQKFFEREDIKKHPFKLYVFGDNDERIGMGGQAFACRGEPNTIGIRTKLGVGHREVDYLSDKDYFMNCFMITQDFITVFMAIAAGDTIVLPEDGLGTGLAELPTRAPRTLAYIEKCIANLKRFDEMISDNVKNQLQLSNAS